MEGCVFTEAAPEEDLVNHCGVAGCAENAWKVSVEAKRRQWPGRAVFWEVVSFESRRLAGMRLTLARRCEVPEVRWGQPPSPARERSGRQGCAIVTSSQTTTGCVCSSAASPRSDFLTSPPPLSRRLCLHIRTAVSSARSLDRR